MQYLEHTYTKKWFAVYVNFQCEGVSCILSGIWGTRAGGSWGGLSWHGCACWSKDLADELDLASEIKRNQGWLLGFQPQHLRAPFWDGEDGRSGSSEHVMWTSLISGYGRRDVEMWKFDSECAGNHRGLFHHPFPSRSACSPTLIWCFSAQM